MLHLQPRVEATYFYTPFAFHPHHLANNMTGEEKSLFWTNLAADSCLMLENKGERTTANSQIRIDTNGPPSPMTFMPFSFSLRDSSGWLFQLKLLPSWGIERQVQMWVLSPTYHKHQLNGGTCWVPHSTSSSETINNKFVLGQCLDAVPHLVALSAYDLTSTIYSTSLFSRLPKKKLHTNEKWKRKWQNLR